jgi:cation diffusion facilitator CzcD-associated flavoprotein CzcO
MPYRVVVVGAGFGGIGMAIALKRAGIEDFVVLDKADDLGGTWRDNSYPGLCCDVPSQLYSYSFRPWRWSRRFPPREEILAYLHGLVAEGGLGPHLRFGAGVAAAEFDERHALWNLTLDDGETLQATAVVCAVGQLGRPSLPDISGRDEFAGPWWHSARWNHDVDLTGRRVAVIGTGASAIQFVPEIAKVAGHLDVYQRTAPYVLPKADRPYGTPSRRCMTGCPWCVRPTGSASSSTVSCSPAASSCRPSCWPGRCSCGGASSAARSPTRSCEPSASPTT